MSKASKNKALVVLNAHHLRRQLTSLPLQLDPRDLNETLVIWLPGWLDELTSDLEGKTVTNNTHGAAMKRCLAAIATHTGLKFEDPILTSEGLAMNDLTKPTPAAKPTAKVQDAAAAPIPGVAAVVKKAVKAKAKPAIKAAVKPNVKAAVKPIGKDIGRAPVKKGAATAKGIGDENHDIKVLAKSNPKREGTAAHKVFAIYAKSKTVGDFLKHGGSRLALRYDLKQGFIKLVRP